jgi:hypothetical protein
MLQLILVSPGFLPRAFKKTCMHWVQEQKERIHIMDIERQKAKEISAYMERKGWKKEIGIPRFEKNGKEARLIYPYLVFTFTIPSGYQLMTYHRIKIF